jgi:hypothetical protein
MESCERKDDLLDYALSYTYLLTLSESENRHDLENNLTKTNLLSPSLKAHSDF